MTDNLKFWNDYEKTDPNFTKNSNISGQHRTGVDAQYKKKRITEAFGMYGCGWGVLADSEQYERIHYENSTCLLIYRATAFYVYKNKHYTFPIAASIKESYVTKNGSGYLKIDDEAVKKVRTDALTKGFTDLGFNADVHMGKFDDQAYVNEAANEAAINNASDKDAERAKQARALEEEVDKVIGQINSANSMSELEGLYKAIIRRIPDKEKLLRRKVIKAKDEAKQRINPEEKQDETA